MQNQSFEFCLSLIRPICLFPFFLSATRTLIQFDALFFVKNEIFFFFYNSTLAAFVDVRIKMYSNKSMILAPNWKSS